MQSLSLQIFKALYMIRDCVSIRYLGENFGWDDFWVTWPVTIGRYVFSMAMDAILLQNLNPGNEI